MKRVSHYDQKLLLGIFIAVMFSAAIFFAMYFLWSEKTPITQAQEASENCQTLYTITETERADFAQGLLDSVDIDSVPGEVRLLPHTESSNAAIGTNVWENTYFAIAGEGKIYTGKIEYSEDDEDARLEPYEPIVLDGVTPASKIIMVYNESWTDYLILITAEDRIYQGSYFSGIGSAEDFKIITLAGVSPESQIFSTGLYTLVTAENVIDTETSETSNGIYGLSDSGGTLELIGYEAIAGMDNQSSVDMNNHTYFIITADNGFYAGVVAWWYGNKIYGLNYEYIKLFSDFSGIRNNSQLKLAPTPSSSSKEWFVVTSDNTIYSGRIETKSMKLYLKDGETRTVEGVSPDSQVGLQPATGEFFVVSAKDTIHTGSVRTLDIVSTDAFGVQADSSVTFSTYPYDFFTVNKTGGGFWGHSVSSSSSLDQFEEIDGVKQILKDSPWGFATPIGYAINNPSFIVPGYNNFFSGNIQYNEAEGKYVFISYYSDSQRITSDSKVLRYDKIFVATIAGGIYYGAIDEDGIVQTQHKNDTDFSGVKVGSPEGIYISKTYNLPVGNTNIIQKVEWDAQVPSGTTLDISISIDNGVNWQTVSNGAKLNLEAGSVQYKAVLTTAEEGVTSALKSVTITYGNNCKEECSTTCTSSGSFIETNKDDFDQGNLQNIDTADSPGAVQLDSKEATEFQNASIALHDDGRFIITSKNRIYSGDADEGFGYEDMTVIDFDGIEPESSLAINDSRENFFIVGENKVFAGRIVSLLNPSATINTSALSGIHATSTLVFNGAGYFMVVGDNILYAGATNDQGEFINVSSLELPGVSSESSLLLDPESLFFLVSAEGGIYGGKLNANATFYEWVEQHTGEGYTYHKFDYQEDSRIRAQSSIQYSNNTDNDFIAVGDGTVFSGFIQIYHSQINQDEVKIYGNFNDYSDVSRESSVAISSDAYSNFVITAPDRLYSGRVASGQIQQAHVLENDETSGIEQNSNIDFNNDDSTFVVAKSGKIFFGSISNGEISQYTEYEMDKIVPASHLSLKNDFYALADDAIYFGYDNSSRQATGVLPESSMANNNTWFIVSAEKGIYYSYSGGEQMGYTPLGLAEGIYESQEYTLGNGGMINAISWRANVPGNTVLEIYYSLDSGGSWLQATNGQEINALAKTIKYKAVLQTYETGLTPSLEEVQIDYSSNCTEECTAASEDCTISNLSAASGDSYRQTKLNWSAPQDIAGYELRYSAKEIIDDSECVKENNCPTLSANQIYFSDASVYNTQDWIIPDGNTSKNISLEGSDPSLYNPSYYFSLRPYKRDETTGVLEYCPVSNIVASSTNRDLSTLEEIEITFQEGKDTKGEISKTEDTAITSEYSLLDFGQSQGFAFFSSDPRYYYGLMKFSNFIGSNNLFNSADYSKHDYLGKEQVPQNSEIVRADIFIFGYVPGVPSGIIKPYELKKNWLEGTEQGDFIDCPYNDNGSQCPYGSGPSSWTNSQEFGATWYRNFDYYTAQGEENYWGAPGASCIDNGKTGDERDLDSSVKGLYHCKTLEDIDRERDTLYGNDSGYSVSELSNGREAIDFFDVTKAVKDWMEENQNYGLLLSGTSPYNYLYSSEYVSNYSRPLLSVVYKLKPNTNVFSPSPITDLNVSNITSDGVKYKQIKLTWTAPASISGYELRYSTSQIREDAEVTSLGYTCDAPPSGYICYSRADIYSQRWMPKNAYEREEQIITLPKLGGETFSLALKSYATDGSLGSAPVFSSLGVDSSGTIPRLATNNDLTTLKDIEITFQYGKDSKGEISQTLDTHLDDGKTSYNYGAATEYNYFERYNYNKNEQRALINFPSSVGTNNFIDPNNPTEHLFLGQEQIPVLNNNPGGLIIRSGMFFLKGLSKNGEAYELLKDWSEGDKNGADGYANWNSATSSALWSQAGASGADFDRLKDPIDIGITNYYSAWNNERYEVDISQALADWVSGDPNYGILLQHSATDSSSGYFTSKNSSTTKDRPIFVAAVEYNKPPEVIFDIDPQGNDSESAFCDYDYSQLPNGNPEALEGCDGYNHIANTNEFSITYQIMDPNGNDLLPEGNCVIDFGDGETEILDCSTSAPQTITHFYEAVFENEATQQEFNVTITANDGFTIVAQTHRVIIYNTIPILSFEADLPTNDPEETLKQTLGADPTPEQIRDYCASHTETGDACDGYSHSYTVTLQNYTTDPDGDPLNCNWDFGHDGQTAAGCEDKEHTFPALVSQDELSRTYTVILEVDDSYVENPIEFSHTVTIYNTMPTASFEIDSSQDAAADYPSQTECASHNETIGDACDDFGLHTETFTLDGTLSWDEDNDPLAEWAWNFYDVDKQEIFSCGSAIRPCDTSQTLPAEIVFLANLNGEYKALQAKFAPGIYYVKLNVKDSYNFWDMADNGVIHKIEVTNQTPVASLDIDDPEAPSDTAVCSSDNQEECKGKGVTESAFILEDLSSDPDQISSVIPPSEPVEYLTQDFWGLEYGSMLRSSYMNDSLPAPESCGIGTLNQCIDFSAYNETGASWMKTGHVGWEAVEPYNPSGNELKNLNLSDGQHVYNWNGNNSILDSRSYYLIKYEWQNPEIDPLTFNLDYLIGGWAKAGLNVQVVIGSDSSWGSEEKFFRESLTAGASTPVKNEYLDDYRTWVKTLVERYDGDNDFGCTVSLPNPDCYAPGDNQYPAEELITTLQQHPVLYYELTSEGMLLQYWQADPQNIPSPSGPINWDPATSSEEEINYTEIAYSVDEYKKLLKATHEAAEEANPEVKIIISGFHLRDVADDIPSADQIDKRILCATAKDDGEKEVYCTDDVEVQLAGWPMEREMRLHLKRGYYFTKELLATGLSGSDANVSYLKQNFSSDSALQNLPLSSLRSDFLESFDIIEFHSMYDYGGTLGQAQWLRQEMQKYGYEKPIWTGDAVSAPNLSYQTNSEFFNPYGETNSSGQSEVLWLGTILGNHNYVNNVVDCDSERSCFAWWYRVQVEGFVKRATLALAAGSQKIMVGLLADLDSLIVSPWEIEGLVDSHTEEEGYTGYWRKPRPVFYAYKYLVEKLNNATQVDDVENHIILKDKWFGLLLDCNSILLPGSVRAFAYKFIRNGENDLYVVWIDDSQGQGSGNTQRICQADFNPDEITGGSTVTTITAASLPTEFGKTDADVSSLSYTDSDGTITLELSEAPLIIEASGTAQTQSGTIQQATITNPEEQDGIVRWQWEFDTDPSDGADGISYDSANIVTCERADLASPVNCTFPETLPSHITSLALAPSEKQNALGTNLKAVFNSSGVYSVRLTARDTVDAPDSVEQKAEVRDIMAEITNVSTTNDPNNTNYGLTTSTFYTTDTIYFNGEWGNSDTSTTPSSVTLTWTLVGKDSGTITSGSVIDGNYSCENQSSSTKDDDSICSFSLSELLPDEYTLILTAKDNDEGFESNIFTTEPIIFTVIGSSTGNSIPIASFDINPPDWTGDDCQRSQENQNGAGTVETNFEITDCSTDPDGHTLRKWELYIDQNPAENNSELNNIYPDNFDPTTTLITPMVIENSGLEPDFSPLFDTLNFLEVGIYWLALRVEDGALGQSSFAFRKIEVREIQAVITEVSSIDGSGEKETLFTHLEPIYFKGYWDKSEESPGPESANLFWVITNITDPDNKVTLDTYSCSSINQGGSCNFPESPLPLGTYEVILSSSYDDYSYIISNDSHIFEVKDLVPPAVAESFIASNLGTESNRLTDRVDISWTEQSNDGEEDGEELVDHYEVSLSTESPQGDLESWFNGASNYSQDWQSLLPGANHIESILGLTRGGVIYYLGLKSCDENNNCSSPAVISITTTRPAALSEATVSPTTGDINTYFRYQIKFNDPDLDDLLNSYSDQRELKISSNCNYEKTFENLNLISGSYFLGYYSQTNIQLPYCDQSYDYNFTFGSGRPFISRETWEVSASTGGSPQNAIDLKGSTFWSTNQDNTEFIINLNEAIDVSEVRLITENLDNADYYWSNNGISWQNLCLNCGSDTQNKILSGNYNYQNLSYLKIILSPLSGQEVKITEIYVYTFPSDIISLDASGPTIQSYGTISVSTNADQPVYFTLNGPEVYNNSVSYGSPWSETNVPLGNYQLTINNTPTGYESCLANPTSGTLEAGGTLNFEIICQTVMTGIVSAYITSPEEDQYFRQTDSLIISGFGTHSAGSSLNHRWTLYNETEDKIADLTQAILDGGCTLSSTEINCPSLPSGHSSSLEISNLERGKYLLILKIEDAQNTGNTTKISRTFYVTWDLPSDWEETNP